MENSSSINRLSEIWKFFRFILDLNQRKLGWLRFVHFHWFQHIFRWLQFSNRPQILSSIPTHSLTDQHPSLHIQFANNLLINIFSEDQFVQIFKSHISFQNYSKYFNPMIPIFWVLSSLVVLIELSHQGRLGQLCQNKFWFRF